MRTLRLLTAALVCLTLGLATALAADQDKGPKEILEELLPKMEKDHGAQQQWQDLCFKAGAPGNEARKAEAAKAMTEKLGGDLPTATRIWLLAQLQLLGGAECVDAVAKSLDDKDPLVFDAACRALANNPSSEAMAKLHEKLKSATAPKIKIALINALGYRRICYAAFVQSLGDADPAVAAAAASALGKMGTPGAAQVLAAARAKAQGDLRSRIDDASLLCADKLLKAGKTQEAKAIYQALNKPESPRAIRMAAFQGTLNTAGDQAMTLVLDTIAGEDADSRQVAVGHIGNLGNDAVKTMAERIQAALAGSDEQKQQWGIRAICNWPNASLADDLLKLAEDAKDGDTRSRLLRSFARVIAAPSPRTSEQKVPLLKQAMEMAQRDEDRAVLLDGAAAVRHVETLRFVRPFLDKPELCEAACKTVVELAHNRNLREPNRGDFTPALEKVIKTAKDPKVVERAKKYLGAK